MFSDLVTVTGGSYDNPDCPVTCTLMTRITKPPLKYCDEGNDAGSCTDFDATEDRRVFLMFENSYLNFLNGDIKLE